MVDINMFSECPHIWTEDEIMRSGDISMWFYGIVRNKHGELVISEIFPKGGYGEIKLEEYDWIEPGKPANIEKRFAEIASDIMYWTPQRVMESASEEDEYDDSKPVHADTIPMFTDDRSPFLKLLDARWLLDHAIECRTESFRLEDVEHLGGDETKEWVDILLGCGIIKESGDGRYRFNRYNPLSSDFKRAYDTLEKWENGRRS